MNFSTQNSSTSTYSVKYCGIVGGTIGILSKKHPLGANMQAKSASRQESGIRINKDWMNGRSRMIPITTSVLDQKSKNKDAAVQSEAPKMSDYSQAEGGSIDPGISLDKIYEEENYFKSSELNDDLVGDHHSYERQLLIRNRSTEQRSFELTAKQFKLNQNKKSLDSKDLIRNPKSTQRITAHQRSLTGKYSHRNQGSNARIDNFSKRQIKLYPSFPILTTLCLQWTCLLQNLQPSQSYTQRSLRVETQEDPYLRNMISTTSLSILYQRGSIQLRFPRNCKEESQSLEFNKRNLLNLRKNQRNDTYYLSSKRKNQLKGFKGFKIKSCEGNDYKSVLHYTSLVMPLSRGIMPDFILKTKARLRTKSSKDTKCTKRKGFNRTGEVRIPKTALRVTRNKVKGLNKNKAASPDLKGHHLKTVNIVDTMNSRDLSTLQNNFLPKKKAECSVMLPRPAKFESSSSLLKTKSPSPLKTAKYDIGTCT
ncbi:unnamed protein product [Moneuplotes crassus]|uniref:Uncharacterized protein n=1 Tax=Euplotes crassus TaxID=5936 RepID=A0AAD1Y7N9_EUPCR|nr:unnamed protein product [Moneuplotes crassus]